MEFQMSRTPELISLLSMSNSPLTSPYVPSPFPSNILKTNITDVRYLSRCPANDDVSTTAMIQAFGIIAGNIDWPATATPGVIYDYCWEGTQIYWTNTGGTTYTVTDEEWWACRDALVECTDRSMVGYCNFNRRNIFSTVAVSTC